MNFGDVFLNEAIKQEALKSHKESIEKLTQLKATFLESKQKIDKEVRGLIRDESVAGQYAKAMDAECTEMMGDCDNIINVLDNDIKLIESKIREIENLKSDYNISPGLFIDESDNYYCREVITSLTAPRMLQRIKIETKKETSQSNNPQFPLDASKKITTTITTKTITITGYEAQVITLTKTNEY